MGTCSLGAWVGFSRFSSLGRPETSWCVSVCVSVRPVHVYPFYNRTHNFAFVIVSVCTVTKCGFSPQRNVCVCVGSAMGQQSPPNQACIRITVYAPLTHTCVKRLASAVIYYTTVIVILSLTTLTVFSLFSSLPSVFPIVNLLCSARVLLVFTVRVLALVIKNHDLL